MGRSTLIPTGFSCSTAREARFNIKNYPEKNLQHKTSILLRGPDLHPAIGSAMVSHFNTEFDRSPAMTFSLFGNKFTRHSGITRLMEDLNDGLRTPGAIMLGGGNPAQIPFAILMGIALGTVYYRTGSLVPCIFMHVLNNSLSTVLSNLYPDVSSSFDLMNPTIGTVVLIVSVIIVLTCAYILKRMYPKPMNVTEE